MLWEAADRVCGKRLRVLIPVLVDAMDRHGHLDMDPIIRNKVLQISAATIDRMLAAARLHIDGQRKRRKAVGSANSLRVAMLICLVTSFCSRRTIRRVANYVRQQVSTSSIFDAAMRRCRMPHAT